MDKLTKLAICLGFIATLPGCGGSPVPEEEEAGRTNVPVTITQIRTGPVTSYAEFNATSSFLLKAVIKAPVAGYIDQVAVTQGQTVDRNQSVFTLRTKESAALAPDTSGKINFTGVVRIGSSITGTVLKVEHPAGDYVGEGDLLCEIADQSSMVFLLDVPYELSKIIRLNAACQVVLPDDRTIAGQVTSRLPMMGSQSQTERFIIKPTSPANLPENLLARVRVVKETIPGAVTLPRSCILSDETMQHFWVMKLINDSTAVKVTITPGITQDGYIQVVSPALLPADRFLSSGNYGLADTASVKIVTPAPNE